MRPGLVKLLPCLAFVSGAAALTYESLWMRSFGLIFGVTTHAISVTLCAFMGGLALGSWLVSRLVLRNILRAYAAVEAGIGLSALLTLPILRTLPAWYGSMMQGRTLPAGMETGLRLAAAASVVLVPTILLGATFPLLVELLARAGRGFHVSLGRLYLVNTLGGAAGVALGAFVLLPAIGVTGTFFVAASLNIVVGAIAFAGSRDVGTMAPSAAAQATAATTRTSGAAAPPPDGRATLPGLFLVAAVATGACSFGLEILWTRALALVIGSSIYSFNLMLLAFLIGIVLGTALYDHLRPRIARPDLWLGATLAGVGLLILGDLWLVGWLPLVFFNLMRVIPVEFLAHQAAGFGLCLLAMLPVTIAFGFSFPLLVHLVTMGRRTPQQVSGLLYAWNTLGAIAGALATSFLLVPATGMQASFVWMAGLPLFAGFLFLAGARAWTSAVRAAAFVALGLGIFLLGWTWRPWDLRLMTAGIYKNALGWLPTAQPGFFWLQEGLKQTRDLLLYEEGREAVVTAVRTGGDVEIVVNGKTDGGTSRWDSTTQKLLAHVPLMLHPDPRRVMVIGWGSGGTAGSAALYPLTDLHAVEIEPAVFDAAPLFAAVNRGVERDPRFRITFEDARTVLLTSPATYDVIVSVPSNPWISGVSNMFTEDFYRIVRPRLAEHGILCQWFHYYNMSVEDVRTQVRTFTAVFPDAALFVVPPAGSESGPLSVSGDLLLLGSASPIVLDMERARRRFADAAIGADLAAAGVADALDLMLDQAMDRDDLVAFAGAGPRNTDDRPVIEFSAPKGLFLPTDANAAMYARLVAGGRAALPPLLHEPALDPASPPRQAAAARVGIAEALHRKGMLDKAKRVLDDALALDPGSGAAHGALGEILYVEGRKEEGEKLLARAIEEDAGLDRPYAILGFVYYERRDLKTARRMFDALAERFPSDANGFYGRALIGVEEQKWAESRADLEKALALQPEFDQAKQLLALVDRQSRYR
jgi:spermidine synthase